MRELEILEKIKSTLSKNSFIGDDCAHLQGLGIVVTQDSLVEGIHFSRKFSTPYQLGYKAIAINLSDIYASGAIPAYMTVSLSLPKNIDDAFITSFYKACDELSKRHGFEVIGGDITGSDKIYVSVCAIGLTNDRKISSRKHAMPGDTIITTGPHGSSAAGLWILKNFAAHKDTISKLYQTSSFISTHLNPRPQKAFSEEISLKAARDYAMMDSSDGLIDAVYKISQASNVTIELDFDKIPYEKDIIEVARIANLDYRNWIFFGGEDYQLIASVDKETLKLLSVPYTIIGHVKQKKDEAFVHINFDGKIKKIQDLNKTYDHFGEQL